MNELKRLKLHLDNIWKAYATSSNLIGDYLNPGNEMYLNRKSQFIHSKESAAYLYLVTSQNFLRTADKIISLLKDEDLQDFRQDYDSKFPLNKTARDILEHFEDYAVGDGRLQKSGKVDLENSYLEVFKDDEGQRIIKLFNQGEFNMGTLDWYTDGFMKKVDRAVFEYLNPDKKWPGWWPKN